MGGFLAYLKGQVEKKVEVELPRGVHAEDLLNQNFDSVIVATGSSPRSQARYPEAKGVDCWDVLRGKAKLDGNRVVVLGKGRVACETSEFMARRRKKEVTIIHSGPPEELANDMEPIFERRLLLERMRDCGVAILNGTSVIEITPEGVQARGQTSGWIPCDHVVLEEAPVPDRSLLEELQGKMETIAVGDCLAPGDIYQAIHDGFRAGYRIE